MQVPHAREEQLSFQHKQLLTCRPAADLEATSDYRWSISLSKWAHLFDKWSPLHRWNWSLIPLCFFFTPDSVFITKKCKNEGQCYQLHRLSNACTVLIYAGPSCQRRTALFPTPTAADLRTSHRSGGNFWQQVKHLSVTTNSSLWQIDRIGPSSLCVFLKSRFCIHK